MTATPLLRIVGVGHVFQIGDHVQAIVRDDRPAAVAIELDAERYQGLMQGDPDAPPPPGAPRAYRDMARFQQDMARQQGGRVGDEMRAAVYAARETGAQLLLVDAPAEHMMRRALAQMGWRERARFFWETFRTRFRMKNQEKLDKEIERLRQDPQPMIEQMGKRYPTLHRVLIEERNDLMATKLRQAMAEHHRVVAFVGDGHVEGLAARLGDLRPTLTRLKDLQASRPTAGIRFTVQTTTFGSDFYEPPT